MNNSEKSRRKARKALRKARKALRKAPEKSAPICFSILYCSCCWGFYGAITKRRTLLYMGPGQKTGQTAIATQKIEDPLVITGVIL